MRKSLVIPAMMLAACAGAPQQSLPEPGLRDGIYGAEQAARGLEAYRRECAVCHAENMRGGPGSAAVAGVGFQYLWEGRSLGELFALMRATMPPGRQGALADRQYADILAAILEANGFPPGEGRELQPDAAALERFLLSWEQAAQ